jgi:hypothetical protein
MKMLTVQYRMNVAIMNWSSQEMYGACTDARPTARTTRCVCVCACARVRGRPTVSTLAGGRLEAGGDVGRRLLCELPNVKRDHNTSVPLVRTSHRTRLALASLSLSLSLSLSVFRVPSPTLCVCVGAQRRCCSTRQAQTHWRMTASAGSQSQTKVVPRPSAPPVRTLSPPVWSRDRTAAEARLVTEHVKALINAGLAPADIGVITPYNAQVR